MARNGTVVSVRSGAHGQYSQPVEAETCPALVGGSLNIFDMSMSGVKGLLRSVCGSSEL